ncbi:hypothetical protein ACGFNV_23810 [Streptomyces sp. NPDC048751]|uniref:hypothetical protein n=1 Tax=Streptomyces sp. NPDC048751 TaxID=3365591 RepID=UPI0037101BEB
MSREQRKREKQVQDAFDRSTGFYTATVDAPPYPHTVLGVVVGQERSSPVEALVSMQEGARALGADGVLGTVITGAPPTSVPNNPRYFAYGTAVRWAATED